MQGFSILGYTARWDLKEISKKEETTQVVSSFFVRFVSVCRIRLRDLDVHNQNQNNEYECKNRSNTAQDLVLRLALAHSEIAFRRACNCTGQALILARLHQHASNQYYSQNTNDNSQYNLKYRQRRINLQIS